MFMNINPPTDNCEICGKDVDHLESFDEIPGGFVGFSNKSMISRYITNDRKLSKTFRSYFEGYSEASWECRDCFYLSNDEAVSKATSSS